jgi:hypothetical protein
MTRPKIRSFIAILAAAVAVAAVLAPVASAGSVPTTGPGGTLVTQTTTTTNDTIARINDGRYKNSLEAKRRKADNCSVQQLIYEQAQDDYLYWNNVYQNTSNDQIAQQFDALQHRQEAADTMAQAWSALVAWGCR